MSDFPFALALVAGALAAVNPCGFALLPAYATFLITGDEEPTTRRWWTTIARALALTAAMTLGFVLVFGLFGVAIAPFAPWLTQHLPWLTIVIGLLLVAAGVWLALGRELPSIVPKLGGPKVRRSFVSMTVFGAAFAIASLGCTIAPFLAVVVSTFRTESVVAGVGLYLAYALGMGLVIGVVSLAIALAKDGLVKRVRRALPLVSRIAGALLLVAGAYVAYYGWYELRVAAGGDTDDPVVAAASEIQAWLTMVVEAVF
ncbi:cytochrome c biogenesis CcdA family protein [Stackebrandtia nassauensis]|uniref:Cytochrome c biogenesis protein transmembrane region n=1 Tax=Stackebrandtia nassauensis (strain DSM 44728 / CIP 108903 / NRRL B-16338 / NBRC 102104 / LLR-40K-21) TaxID=446470 RepID=D3Q1Y0_STANL|nr:cytochrome c biogenesis CcdA family protein [Stackebrandtia nassauensis]ADD41847.1 cytochrome c biogenesis protein transmembrane region [Stackebrandtia nassauensis DSM 44728]